MNRSLLALPVLLLASMFIIPGGVLPVHAASTIGEVCIAQPTLTTKCPTDPAVLAIASNLATDVNVNYGGPVGAPAYNTFDISVFVPTANLNILSPSSSSVTVNSFFGIVAQECVEGIAVTGTCSPTDGPGVVHVVAGTLNAPDNANRTLFTIHYTAGTTTTAGVGILFLNGQSGAPDGPCSATSTSDGTTCVTMVNPSTSANNPVIVQTGLFSSTATMFVTAAPNTLGTLLGTALTISGGSSGTTRANVTGVLGLTSRGAGTVAMSTTVSVPGPTATLVSASLTIPRACSLCSVTDGLTITVPAGFGQNFTVTVTGSESGGSVAVTASAVVLVTVPLPPVSLVSVVVGNDGNLYSSSFTGSWGTWQALNGQSPSPPTLCASSPTSTELVVRGTDNQVYHKTFSGSSFSANWDNSPGGVTIDQPACAVLGTILYVVVRGATGEIWATTFDLSAHTWAATWTDLLGFSPSAPALAATSSLNRLDLVVRGTDDQIYHKAFTSGTWAASWDTSNRTPIPDKTVTTPAIVSDGSNLHVVVVGEDYSLYYVTRSLTSGTWSTYTNLVGSSPTTPSLLVDPAGTLHLVVLGFDQHVYAKAKPSAGAFDAAWSNAGGITKNRPAAVMLGSNVAVVATGFDSRLWYNTQTAGTWSGWVNMNGAAAQSPGLSTP